MMGKKIPFIQCRKHSGIPHSMIASEYAKYCKEKIVTN